MKEIINKEIKQELPFFKLDYSKLKDIEGNNIVPAAIIDAKTGSHLMTGYMTEATYKETVVLGKVVFWSRSRQERWLKGETSGNILFVTDIKKGCEDDALAIYANPTGPVCHRNTWTCFDDMSSKNISREQRFGENQLMSMKKLYSIIESRKSANPEDSYVARSFNKEATQIFKKVGEEGTELAVAATKFSLTKLEEDKNRVIEEAADVFFQTLMTLAKLEISLEDVFKELEKRNNQKQQRTGGDIYERK